MPTAAKQKEISNILKDSVIYYNIVMTIEQNIKRRAVEIGFDAVGITTAQPVDEQNIRRLQKWLKDCPAGQMDYMRRNIEKRIDPGKLLNNARSVICVALNYKSAEQINGPDWRTAEFAIYPDYHKFIKERLALLVDYIVSQTAAQADVRFRICVDTSAVSERALAQRAGLGFIGKNHFLIHPKLGPSVLLGEIITTIKLLPDEPYCRDGCGDCEKCLTACPSGVFDPEGRFDVRRCVSYLTCEYRGNLSGESCDAVGEYIYGCDRCMKACPYYTASPPAANRDLKPLREMFTFNREQLAEITSESFRRIFGVSAMNHLDIESFRRNCRLPAKDSAGMFRQPRE